MSEQFANNGRSGAADDTESEHNVEFWQRVYVVRRRWWLILAGGILALAWPYWLSKNQVAEYVAEGVVQRKDERATRLGGLDIAPPNLISELEILRSGGVLGGAVESLGLRVVAGGSAPPPPTLFTAVRTTRDALPGTYALRRDGDAVALLNSRGEVLGRTGPDGRIYARGIDIQLASASFPLEPVPVEILPHEDALRALQRGLSLVQIPGTNLIRITYRGMHPEKTAAVVNGVMRAYQDFSSRTGRDDARKRREAIATQLAAIADSLAVAQQMVIDYQTSSGTMDPKDQGGLVAAALVAAQTEVRTLKYQETILQSLLSGLNSTNSSDDAVRRVMILGRDLVPTVSDLYGRLQQYATERSQLTAGRAGLTREALRVEVLDSLMADVKRDIKAVTEQSLAALRGRLRATEGRMAELESELAKYPGRASAFSRLAQRADAVQSTYNMLAANYFEAQIAEQVDPAKVDVIQVATTPRSPVAAQSRRLFILAFMLGLLAGVALAFLLEYMDRRVRTPTDVERASRLKLLGGIPFIPTLKQEKSPPLVMLNGDNGAGAESFRTLRTAILFARAERPRVVAVTSSSPSEGKSFIAANFALAMAKQGTSVLLIDCDLRRPTVHELFRVPRVPGLTDMLVGNSDPTVHAAHKEIPNLQLLPSGTSTTSPAELLGSKEFARLMESFRGRFDLIVLDTPPVLAVSDVTSLVRLVDGVLVVARSEVTDRFALTHTVARLRHVDAPMLGVVLNSVKRSGGRYSAYGDYGYYGAEYAKYYQAAGTNSKPAQPSFVDRILRRR